VDSVNNLSQALDEHDWDQGIFRTSSKIEMLVIESRIIAKSEAGLSANTVTKRTMISMVLTTISLPDVVL
jgi:hypothetical protein